MSEWTTETADWYAANYGEYPTNQRVIELLEIAEDAVVVDVGCGTGSALRHASEKVTRGRLIGVDPVPRMVEIARERLLGHPAAARIELLEAPAHVLPLAEGSADLVLALDSYDHWGAEQAAGLREVRRILRPEGRFVVVKDGGLPGGEAAVAAFIAALGEAGFAVVEQRDVAEEELSFTCWVCSPRP